MSALADNSGLRPPQEPLGTLLVHRGLITAEQLNVALAEQQTSGKPLGAIVVALEFATPASVAQALATQHGGVLKTEYGFATGFGAGSRPPEVVSAPPVSAPRITKTSSSESNKPALRVDRPVTPGAAEVDREAVRSELEHASQETERLADANERLTEVRAELEQRLATERQRVSSLEADVAARDGQISELTAGAVAWQNAYTELERGQAQEIERARGEIEAQVVSLEAELAERNEELEDGRKVMAAYWAAAKNHLDFFPGLD